MTTDEAKPRSLRGNSLRFAGLNRLYMGVSALLFLLFITGCGGPESMHSPAGIQDHRILGQYWLTFWIALGVYVLTLLFFFGAIIWPRSSNRDLNPNLSPNPAGELVRRNSIVAAIVVTACLLFLLMIHSYTTQAAIDTLTERNPLQITIIGHQWWWEIHYDNSDPSKCVTTANEIHLPAGRPVVFKLRSDDVIHSFWVPNLAGKKDLVPGHPTSMWLQADKLGTYWGQCAQFCGMEHANMRFLVIVEPPETFKTWLNHQRQYATEPATDQQILGKEVFLTSSCVMCHAINGTPARSMLGPDLTHFASRLTIGAGTVTNSIGNLAGWISDSQRIKPGNWMPQNTLDPKALDAVVAYLESLK